MDYLMKKSREASPKFNSRLVEGVPVKELAEASRYLDSILRIAKESWPEGLEYDKLEPCSTREAYEVLSGRKTESRSKRPTGKSFQYDVARTDLYLVKLRLKWHGKELIPRYLPIPFCGTAGTFHIRGPLNTIHPVLADPTLSVAKESIFIPFVRDRVTFFRLLHEYRKQGMGQQTYVVWSNIHGYAPGPDKATAPKTTVIHYLFCRHGLKKTFELYADTQIHVGTSDINTQNYPESEGWRIYSSIGRPPKAHQRDRSYRSHNVRIAMQESCENTLTKSMIAAFFYVADHFPDRMDPQDCEDPDLWKVLLGLMLDYSDRNEGRLITDVETHLASLDQYVDQIVKDDLRKAKPAIYCDDIYDLFVYITKWISMFLMHTELSNLHDKKLLVNRYVMLDYTKAIFGFTYRLTGNAKKEITEASINQAAGRYLNPNIIFSLSKNHGEINVISSPGDCYLLKHSGKFVLQVDATSRRGSAAKRQPDCPSRHLHVSFAEVGSYRNLPKSEPTGQTHANPCMMLYPDLRIKRNPKLVGLLDRTQPFIRRE